MYTFDVFDTLITRTVAEPKGIFALMQEQMNLKQKYKKQVPEYVIKHFVEYRINAELEAESMARYKNKKSVTLDEIYEMLCFFCGLNEKAKKMLVELEIETEYQNVVPIWENINLAKKMSKKYCVVLISDMYLSSNVIKRMLCKFEPLFANMPLFVSCENDKTKRTGELYSLVLETMGQKKEQWVHIGNDKYSDKEIVQRIGGKTKFYSAFNLSRREKKILDETPFGIEQQLLVGAVRKKRAELRKKKREYAVGLEIAGPILYGYITWILEKSIEENIQTLYFVARDGYILKRLADAIIKKRRYEIETKYIFGSRAAWKIPEEVCEQEMIAEYVAAYTASTINELLWDFNIEKEDLEKYLSQELLKNDGIISNFELNAIKSRIIENEELCCKVVANTRKRKYVVIEYLKQEIDTRKKFAFVELNGSGCTQIQLAKMINEFCLQEIPTFYYSMRNVTETNHGKSIFYKYSHDILYKNYTMELLARAPHGQTMNYQLEGDKYIPILNSTVKDYVDNSKYEEYIRGACDFLGEMENYELAKRRDYSDISVSYLKYANRFEDKDVQHWLGDMPFSSSCFRGKIYEYAPILSSEELDMICTCSKKGEWKKFYKGENIEYSLLRLPAEKKKRLKAFLLEENDREVSYGISQYLKPKGRMVLYGAGKCGKRLYSQLKETQESRIVLWVDENYKKMDDVRIKAPEEMFYVDFDCLVIGILDYKVYHEVRMSLIKKGIPASKIL